MNTLPLPMSHSHDLRLPAWGPYTKKYNGLAHIPDLGRGIRFDVSVFPGYYRHRVSVPHSQWESGYHPWEASPGLRYFSYRYDLEWKDQVYCDVAFFAFPDEPEADARLVRCEFVNQTSLPQHQVLHYMTSLNFPPLKPYSEEAVIPADIHLPEGALWLDALDYTDLQYATPRPDDNLVYEGWLRGESRAHGFVDGVGIGCGFGAEAGDRVWYDWQIPQGMQDGVLLARYRAPRGGAAFEAHGLINAPIVFEQAEDFRLLPIPLGSLPAGRQRLELVSLGGSPLELDGFVLLETRQQERLSFTPHAWNPVPQLQPGAKQNTLMLRYAEVSNLYGLAWTGPFSEVRQFFSSELDRTLRYFVTEHVQRELHADDRGHFTNVFIRPIVLEPHTRQVLYGLVCSGNEADVARRLADFELQTPSREGAYLRARQEVVQFESNPSGQVYLFSQERMAATLLTNVVYPVYTRRSYIRHFTPGKRWDCLYTWDSGFISLGLLDVDLQRGIDCLNAYTTPPGDQQAAFIHHGSPVPVQMFAYQELWNRTRSRELLAYFYPRLRQYYRFIAGRLGSSTTRRMKSGLLKTWDYFYNSGGWDDYPPQVAVRAQNLQSRVTPVVTTAHAIRSAKILQQAARELGLEADLGDYQADIDLWTEALNRYAWDEAAGIFSYVVHDEGGQPVEFLRHPAGQNYNLGLDGLSPFFAGVCNPEQEGVIYRRMESEAHFWTPVGLTTVDQQAAYYRADGYWNGAVWFPYQWFIWKALLDMDYGDLAFRIARTALETWKDELKASYNCFEHFIVSSRRGTGWHHFGGLSTPVLSWFRAYHRPGTLTCGYDTWIESLQISSDRRSLTASLKHAASPRPWIALAVLPPDGDYSAAWNGSPVQVQPRYPGTLELHLQGSGTLIINAA